MRELEAAKTRLAERERQLATVVREARLDQLTHLANRRAFDERLAEMQSQFDRYQELFSVGLFDLDHFKSVNDTCGHAAGDAVLLVFARVLTQNVRDFDFAARLGGEEFAVLLPGANATAARAAMERVRKSVERASVIYSGKGITFSVSGGVAEALKGEAVSNLLRRVDEALYAAKTNGRNCIKITGELPLTGTVPYATSA